MIKATGLKQGRPTIFLGLTRKNLEKFLAEMGDTFIFIDRAEMGLTFDIIVFSGEDEETLAKLMAPSIGPDTVIHDRRRKP